MKKFFKNVSDKFFWRQHPEAALRYLPAVSEIKKRDLQNSKILEVGSGSLGIIPYLKTQIDGIDVDFSGPQTDLLNRIQGTADKLPFKKNSYDVVISVDVLEHLKPNMREKAILEILRVAKKLAIIVVPCGDKSQIQDKQLQKKWNELFNDKNQFLEEHVKYGLPKKEEVLVFIDKSIRRLKKQATVKSYPNLNLSIRHFLMETWITKNKILYYLYLKGFLLFVPILKYCNFGKTYRHVFMIEFAS